MCVSNLARKVGRTYVSRVPAEKQLSLFAVNPLAAGKLGTDSSSLDRRCPSRISIYITVVPCNEVEMEYPERRDRDSPGLPAAN